MVTGDLGRWAPLPVETLPVVLADLDCWWCVAAGVGLELFAGRRLRAHDDIDIEIPRSHQTALVRALPDWEHYAAHQGVLTKWHGDRYLDAENSVWSRRNAAAPWSLQTMFATIDAGKWVYRRAPRVRVPLNVATRTTDAGIPYLAPELALLFKASGARPKDEADFDVVSQLLDGDAKDWLAWALGVAHPAHPWIARLT